MVLLTETLVIFKVKVDNKCLKVNFYKIMISVKDQFYGIQNNYYGIYQKV